MSFPFGETKIVPEARKGNHSAHCYKFTHAFGPNPSGMYYRGTHGLKEHESSFDGAYWNSSTDKEFIELLETKPEEFRYEIDYVGSMQEMFKLENELLTKADAASDPMSWNKWNGFTYKTKERPRLKLIKQLAKDAYDENSGLERESVRVSDLYDQVVRLQSRFDQSESRKKIRQYKNRMKSQNSTEGFTITIIRRSDNTLLILVGGNHTLEAAYKAGMQFIDVVYVDEELTMQEMYSYGDALNKEVELQRMTTEKESVATKLVNMYEDGTLDKDDRGFKSQYCTDYIKTTGGFKGTDLSEVRKLAKEMLKEKGEWITGKRWISRSNNNKQKKEDEATANALTTDSTFCIAMSSSFRADRVMEKWVVDADSRISAGLDPRPNIKILMHYPSYLEYQKQMKENNRETHQRIIKSCLRGEGIESPEMFYEDLVKWEDTIK